MKQTLIQVISILGFMLLWGCHLGHRPKLAIVSPHLEVDPYAFSTAAQKYAGQMQTNIYGISGSGKVPMFSVEALSKHDLVIFESLGARLSLIKPQIDSIKARTKVIFLETPLAVGNVPASAYPDLKTYWNNGNQENYGGMLSYIGAKLLKVNLPVVKPVIYPLFGYYHPGSDSLFKTADAYLKWYGKKHPARMGDTTPAVGVVFYQSNYIKHDMRHVDALIKNIEQHGARPVPLMQKSGFKLDSFLMLNHKPIVDVVLYGGLYLNFSKPEKGRQAAAKLDVPLLGAATHYRKDIATWEKDAGGFSPEMTDRFYFTERDGVFEPVIIGAEKTLADGRRFVEPIPYQVNWRVERALAWAKLRHTANSEKKIVATYYSEGSGKANIGGDIDAYLDVPQSIIGLLQTWKNAGYNAGQKPLPTAAQLTQQMALHASNVGTWAPQELKKRVTNGDVVIIPESQYLQWFHSYPAAQQQEVIKAWGAAPGKVMTLTDSTGHRSIVIPIIKYGNIILAPHPNWGLQDNHKLIYGKAAIPPSHAYLAFYEWMKRVYQPQAFLSLFTQLSLMPGKMEGPSAKDWNGRLIGNIPHISLVPLVANAGIGNKRRASGLTIGYLTEITQAGLSDSLKTLNDVLTDWQTATNPAVKAQLQTKALRLSNKLQLQKDLNNETLLSSKPAQYLEQVQSYIRKIGAQKMAHGGHILGAPPKGAVLTEMITEMLGKEFEQILPGKQQMASAMVNALMRKNQTPGQVTRGFLHRTDIVIEKQLQTALLYKAQLNQAGNEITQVMRALDGRYIPTGPTDDPIRNPESIPSGRNPYAVNTKAIPTRAAWALGQRMADQLLLQYEQKHGNGQVPKKVAFVLWSAEVTNNQGVSEAEIMYLMGVRPVWNSKGQVMDVELMPDAQLGRERIDVLITTSGTYRDHFYGNIKMLDKAVKLVASVKTGTNWVRNHSQKYQKQLRIDSMETASLRIFSSNQGAYSTNVEFAGEDSESWKSDTTVSNLYLNRMAHAYGEKAEASYQRRLFELNIRDVDAAAFSRSSNVYGVMDHPMVAAYFGAYNLAVKNTTGREPDMFINDLADTSASTVSPLGTFFHAELRSRYLNPKWIKANMVHGYDGARYLEAFTENMLLWNTTNRTLVSDQDWNNVYNTYVNDSQHVGVKEYMEQANPYAKQAMLSHMLEASEKGYWRASAVQLNTLAEAVAASVARNGAACNTVVCNSPKLAKYIRGIVANTPGGRSLAVKYVRQLQKVKGTPDGSRSAEVQLNGRQMTEVKLTMPSSKGKTGGQLALYLLAAMIFGLFGLGWICGSKIR